MPTPILIILLILLAIVVYVVVNLAQMSVDDFFKKIWLKTMWLWLPIHAFFRLTKELREKKRR